MPLGMEQLRIGSLLKHQYMVRRKPKTDMTVSISLLEASKGKNPEQVRLYGC
jgi:hypothetical protein